MVRLMDLIDVHNSIDTMKFSSFVDDYMYDDAFHDMVEAAGITPLDFVRTKKQLKCSKILMMVLKTHLVDLKKIRFVKRLLFLLMIKTMIWRRVYSYGNL